jgi:hypothetical protein
MGQKPKLHPQQYKPTIKYMENQKLTKATIAKGENQWLANKRVIPKVNW